MIPDWGFLVAMFFGGLSYYLMMRFYGAKKCLKGDSINYATQVYLYHRY